MDQHSCIKILESEFQASAHSPNELNVISDLELLSFHGLGEELKGGILEEAETSLAVFDVQLHQLIQAPAPQEIQVAQKLDAVSPCSSLQNNRTRSETNLHQKGLDSTAEVK